jgi:hypothetical protein
MGGGLFGFMLEECSVSVELAMDLSLGCKPNAKGYPYIYRKGLQPYWKNVRGSCIGSQPWMHSSIDMSNLTIIKTDMSTSAGTHSNIENISRGVDAWGTSIYIAKVCRIVGRMLGISRGSCKESQLRMQKPSGTKRYI